MLRGVGDASLGQWADSRPKALHLRRRLSADEAKGWTLRDIRHTPEARERFDSMPAHIRSMIPPEMLAEEVAA